MPPKKTTKKQDSERIAELERQLQMSHQTNEDLKNAAIEKEKQAHNAFHLKIAKPAGQAGRRSGYRLEMAMGIESNHFLRILRLVRVYAGIYLDIRMSISEQGKTKLQLAKAKIATHIPIFKRYKSLWPLHEMLRQYLGTHKISFEKDKVAEETETSIPDRKAIEVYLHGLESQRSRGSLDEDDEDEDEEDEDEESDQEDNRQKIILKNKKSFEALPKTKTVKFAQANSTPSQVKASASKIEKVANKAPRKAAKVLLAVSGKKLTCDEPAEISGGTDDEDFEPLAPNRPKKGIMKTPTPSKTTRKTSTTAGTKKTKTMEKKEMVKRKANNDAENEPLSKRQRKQVDDEPVEIPGGTDDEDFEPPAPVMFLNLLEMNRPKKRIMKTPTPSKTTRKTPTTAGTKKTKTMEKKEMVKRKVNDDAENECPPKRQRKQKQAEPSDHAKIPSMCPIPMCEDKMPQSPTPYLMGLYEKYHKYTELTRQGKEVGGSVHLAGELCEAITNYWKDGRDAPTTASDNGWPLQIEFESLPDRIVELMKEITGVIANEFVLDGSAAWATFIKNLKGAGCNLREFREVSDWAKFCVVGSNAHAGYYGPMGVMVINSTLGRMFNHGSGTLEELGSTLETLISLKTEDVSHPEYAFWEGADASSVSPKDFLDFIVQPFVATLLISKDLNIGEKEAEETRITSKSYGIQYNYNTDDGRIDDITMKNAILGFKEKGKLRVIPGKFRRKPEIAPNACAGPGPSTMAIRDAAIVAQSRAIQG